MSEKGIMTWVRTGCVGVMVVLGMLMPDRIEAKDLYSVEWTVGGVTATRSYDTATALLDTRFGTINSGYTERSSAQGVVRLRGVDATLQYHRDSNALIVTVPTLGMMTRQFNGSSRADSENLFKEWLRGQGDDENGRVGKEFVQRSPVDPLAGNPTSLLSMMVAADYDAPTRARFLFPPGERTLSAALPKVLGVGLQFDDYRLGGFTARTYRAPFSYAIPLINHVKVVLDAPVQIMAVGEAKAYAASLGLGLQFPINEYWSLTPAVRGGVEGSLDLLSGSFMGGWSLKSDLEIPAGNNVQFHIGNAIGMYSTVGMQVGSVNIDYGLNNTALRNGVAIGNHAPIQINGTDIKWRAFLVDTRYSGDKLYSNRQDELGIGVTFPGLVGSAALEQLSLNAAYTTTDTRDKGVSVGVNYRF